MEQPGGQQHAADRRNETEAGNQGRAVGFVEQSHRHEPESGDHHPLVENSGKRRPVQVLPTDFLED